MAVPGPRHAPPRCRRVFGCANSSWRRVFRLDPLRAQRAPRCPIGQGGESSPGAACSEVPHWTGGGGLGCACSEARPRRPPQTTNEPASAPSAQPKREKAPSSTTGVCPFRHPKRKKRYQVPQACEFFYPGGGRPVPRRRRRRSDGTPTTPLEKFTRLRYLVAFFFVWDAGKDTRRPY